MPNITLQEEFESLDDDQLENLYDLLGNTTRGGISGPTYHAIKAEIDRREKAKAPKQFDVYVRLRVEASDSSTAMNIANAYCNRAESYPITYTKAVRDHNVESAAWLDAND